LPSYFFSTSIFVLSEKIEPFWIRLPIEIGLLVPMVILLIRFSVWLMGSDIHLKLDKLLLYIPILIEFKMFLHELYFEFEPNEKHCTHIANQKQTIKIKFKMNKKSYLILICFLLSICSFSQEINMVVYKGDVKISNRPAYHRAIYKVTDTTTVVCPKDCLVLFYTKAKAFMLKPQTAYSFPAVLKGLNASTQTFIKFMDSNQQNCQSKPRGRQWCCGGHPRT